MDVSEHMGVFSCGARDPTRRRYTGTSFWRKALWLSKVESTPAFGLFVRNPQRETLTQEPSRGSRDVHDL